MTMKFFGTLSGLTELLCELGVVCELSLVRSRHVQYRTPDGGVINWWPTTGTVFLQGEENERIALCCVLKAALSVAKPKGYNRHDDGDEDFDLVE